jgi:hypothetical protein
MRGVRPDVSAQRQSRSTALHVDLLASRSMTQDKRTVEEIRDEIAELKNRIGRRYDGDRFNPPSTFSAMTDRFISDDRGGRYGNGAIDKTQVNGRKPTVSYPASALSDQPDAGTEPPFDIDISYSPITNEPHEIEKAALIAEARKRDVPQDVQGPLIFPEPTKADTTSSVSASFSNNSDARQKEGS